MRSIPIGALPGVLSDEEIALRAALASQLLSATAKAARLWMRAPRRGVLLFALGVAERRLVQAMWKGASDLAVARVDFLGQEVLHALEVNTTIPAMPPTRSVGGAACATGDTISGSF